MDEKKSMKAPADRMMRAGPKKEPLFEVRPGRHLPWPDGAPRGGPGYRVRESDPFIGGFRASLRPYDGKEAASPVNDPLWVRKAVTEHDYHEFGEIVRPEAPPPIKHQPATTEIPEPDA